MIEASVELLIPFLMASVLERADRVYSLKIGAVMLAIVLAGSALATLGQYFSARAATAVSRKLRRDMYEKINSLDFRGIDAFGTASLINRLTADVNAIQNAVLIFVRIAIRAPFLVAGSVIFAMLIDSNIALIIVACMPFLIASFYFITKRLVPKYTAVQKTLDGITLETKENLEGVRVVRAFNKQAREIREFKRAADAYSDMSISAGKMSAGLGPLNTFIINCGVAAIVYFVGAAVSADMFDVANISAFVSYMVQIVTALNMITHLTLSFVKAFASNKRVKELFAAPSEITAPDIPKTKETGGNSELKTDGIGDAGSILEFRDVYFGYGDKGFALKGVSFALRGGETLGIIGGTGSGKTTLISLIPRFYDVKSGAVFYKGRDVGELPAEVLRREVAVVAQEAVVFSGTIKENIRFALPYMPDGDVVRAAKIAQAHEFITRMPKGYDSEIEQNGRNLSGGQKQRISIARGIAKNAEILVLDDSSSALDYLTEARLRAALKELGGVTKIIVSQRVSSVMYADKILVLDKGAVAGEGKHAELLRSCAVYANIYESQNL
jgi:ATP-binding cassette subfamily B protein